MCAGFELLGRDLDPRQCRYIRTECTVHQSTVLIRPICRGHVGGNAENGWSDGLKTVPDDGHGIVGVPRLVAACASCEIVIIDNTVRPEPNTPESQPIASQVPQIVSSQRERSASVYCYSLAPNKLLLLSEELSSKAEDKRSVSSAKLVPPG